GERLVEPRRRIFRVELLGQPPFTEGRWVIAPVGSVGFAEITAENRARRIERDGDLELLRTFRKATAANLGELESEARERVSAVERRGAAKHVFGCRKAKLGEFDETEDRMWAAQRWRRRDRTLGRI